MAISIAARTGDRTQRVQLDAAGKPVPDGDGGYTDTYSPLDPPQLFAKIEAATAASLERLTAGTVTAQASHVITMPFHPGITMQTRVQWTDVAGRPHAANVTSIDNVDERCHTLILGAVEQVL
jgi:head-tail adaptor